MRELLKRIFTDIISQEDDSYTANKYIDSKIQEIADSYNEKFSEAEVEQLRGELYQIAFIAEQEGFLLGMKYLFKIAVSLWKDS